MQTWTPLWSGIVNSSIWDEEDYVLKVFLTMMALKDSDHVYRGNAYTLHKASRKTEVQVLEALKVLSAPDTKRIERQPYDGRRIEAVPDGWLILNGEKYRAMVAKERKRIQNAKRQSEYRERRRQAKGDSVEERNAIATMENPAPRSTRDNGHNPVPG